jgi:enoyl-[acyl-carrier protein] reductase I
VLNGKRLLITGIATEDSIATATARASLDAGARIALTAFPRDLDAARAIASDLGPDVRVHALDLCDPDATDAVGRAVMDDLGGLDGALHAVAFAPAAALSGDFLAADAAATELAFRTSAWSLTNLARMVRDTAPGGGSIVGLDFDAGDRAWPVYNWMGVCKAALRSSATYLARDLGPLGIRVNLVAAGPLHTRAANGIPDFHRLLDAWATTAPLPWSPTDATPVAETVCFLLSDHSRAITGEVLHVDGGYHAMAAPLPGDGTRVHTNLTSGIT